MYEDAGDFFESFSKIKIGSKWGIINTQNEILVPAIYDELYFRRDNKFHIENNGLVGIIDRNFELIIKPQFEEVGIFSTEGLAPFRNNSGYGFIDEAGKIIIRPKFEYAEEFLGGLAIVIFEEQYYLIDTDGNEAIYQSYSYLESQEEEDSNQIFYRCSIDEGAEGIIDNKGNIIIPLMYDSIGYFNEGLAPCCKDGKYGYIDIDNKVIIDFQFENAFEFHEGLARVKKDGRIGFINLYGDIIIPYQYDGDGNSWIDIFQNGYTTVVWNGKMGLINKIGKIIIPFEYKFITSYIDEYNLFFVSKFNGDSMFISNKGLKYWEE